MNRLAVLAGVLAASCTVAAADERPRPPAVPDCTAAPAPAVNWQRCLMDGRALSFADLSGSTLRETRFNRAKLDGTALVGVDARRARFVSADLTAALLTKATLVEADFTKALLRGADLSGADLSRARLYDADLTGANLTGAKLERADLQNARLSGALWTDGTTRCAEGSRGQCESAGAAGQ